jgi:hypothetical protein
MNLFLISHFLTTYFKGIGFASVTPPATVVVAPGWYCTATPTPWLSLNWSSPGWIDDRISVFPNNSILILHQHWIRERILGISDLISCVLSMIVGNPVTVIFIGFLSKMKNQTSALEGLERLMNWSSLGGLNSIRVVEWGTVKSENWRGWYQAIEDICRMMERKAEEGTSFRKSHEARLSLTLA